MKKLGIFLILSILPCLGFAGSHNLMQYERGPAVILYSEGSFAAAYYFGKNNKFSTNIWVEPYAVTQTFRASTNTLSTTTGFGANFYYHMPIKPYWFNNQVFFVFGAGWGQFFGTNTNRPVKYCWGVWGDMGFEYRFNSNLYIYLTANPYEYIETKFKNDNSFLIDQSVFNSAGVWITYKF